VIGVEVGDEHLGELHEADRRAQELPLGPLSAVDEDAVASAPHEHAREPAPRGRHGAGGAQEDEVEIHAASVRGACLKFGSGRPISSSCHDSPCPSS
jgi:hypothetical protein